MLGICLGKVYLAGLHLPDGSLDLLDRLVLEAGLQCPSALVVPVERSFSPRALGL